MASQYGGPHESLSFGVDPFLSNLHAVDFPGKVAKARAGLEAGKPLPKRLKVRYEAAGCNCQMWKQQYLRLTKTCIESRDDLRVVRANRICKKGLNQTE